MILLAARMHTAPWRKAGLWVIPPVKQQAQKEVPVASMVWKSRTRARKMGVLTLKTWLLYTNSRRCLRESYRG
jgi:hypothetical protein